MSTSRGWPLRPGRRPLRWRTLSGSLWPPAPRRCSIPSQLGQPKTSPASSGGPGGEARLRGRGWSAGRAEGTTHTRLLGTREPAGRDLPLSPPAGSDRPLQESVPPGAPVAASLADSGADVSRTWSGNWPRSSRGAEGRGGWAAGLLDRYRGLRGAGVRERRARLPSKLRPFAVCRVSMSSAFPDRWRS